MIMTMSLKHQQPIHGQANPPTERQMIAIQKKLFLRQEGLKPHRKGIINFIGIFSGFRGSAW